MPSCTMYSTVRRDTTRASQTDVAVAGVLGQMRELNRLGLAHDHEQSVIWPLEVKNVRRGVQPVRNGLRRGEVGFLISS